MEKKILPYLLEFKMNSDAATALKQINTKKYALVYSADSRMKIGMDGYQF